jgi:hypothetical protein
VKAHDTIHLVDFPGPFLVHLPFQILVAPIPQGEVGKGKMLTKTEMTNGAEIFLTKL